MASVLEPNVTVSLSYAAEFVVWDVPCSQNDSVYELQPLGIAPAAS